MPAGARRDFRGDFRGDLPFLPEFVEASFRGIGFALSGLEDVLVDESIEARSSSSSRYLDSNDEREAGVVAALSECGKPL